LWGEKNAYAHTPIPSPIYVLPLDMLTEKTSAETWSAWRLHPHHIDGTKYEIGCWVCGGFFI